MLNMDYSEGEHLLFEVLLHLGTMISICFVYRKEIKAMVSDGLEFLRMRSDPDLEEPLVPKPPARALLFVFIGTLPLLLVFVLTMFIDIKQLFFNTGFVGFALIVTGGLLFVSDKFIKRGNKTEKTMTLMDALVIGFSQAVAVVPGLSRSGTTISVGLTRGLAGSFAVRFSLLLSIPAVFGATLHSLYSVIRSGADFSLLPVYLAGFVVSTVIGFFAIGLIRRLMSKGSFGKFAYYCWAVGALTLILYFVL